MKCKICGCVEEEYVFGMCLDHYVNVKKFGNAEGIRIKNKIEIFDDHAEVIIKDKDGYEKCRAIIDMDDISMVKEYKWCLNSQGYAFSSDDNKNILLHRLIMGFPEKGLVVDHINRNRLDDRKCNLRVVKQYINTANREKVGCIRRLKNNERKPYIARLRFKNRSLIDKRFATEGDAKRALNEVIAAHHDEMMLPMDISYYEYV